eukprot:104383-Amorphochlora_amoeboformis.AAC.1
MHIHILYRLNHRASRIGLKFPCFKLIDEIVTFRVPLFDERLFPLGHPCAGGHVRDSDGESSRAEVPRTQLGESVQDAYDV